MDFSVNWLKRYIETDLAVDRIAEVLTDQGLTVDEIRSLSDDTILDIDVTTNRPDAMNYMGLARELAASGNGATHFPTVRDLPESEEKVENHVAVEIRDADLCGRYVARVVKGVEIGPSPQWMQDLLASVGIRPINNVVDITNFVLWETGHPLHAFDKRFLKGNRIVVRRAHAGESMVTLDGEERKLLTDDLVIADAERPVALAGIMGGENSEIRDDTSDVVIESAWFQPVAIRRTARRLSLHTDSSYRFERGADIEMARHAADRAAALMVELAGGTLCAGRVDVYPTPWQAPEIRLRAKNFRRILGVDIPGDFVKDTLSALGFTLLDQQGEDTVWSVPAARLDVTREIDLIEEVARMYSYNRLPSTLPTIPSPGRTTSPEEALEQELLRLFTAAGFSQAITYSFCSPSDNQRFCGEDTGMVAIANPLAETVSVMRTAILASLAPVVAANVRKGNREVRLFETGRVYLPGESGAREPRHLAAVTSLGTHQAHWSGAGMEMDVFVLKGLMDAIQDRVLGERVWTLRETTHPAMDPASSADMVLGDRVVGVLGQLSADTLDALECDVPLVACELDLDVILSRRWRTIRFRSFSSFPSSERDAAFLVDRTVTYRDVEAFLSGLEIPLLQAVRLFDRYEGKGIPEGKVSLALNFTFQADDRTLSGDEVNTLHEQIVAAFLEQFKAELR